MRFSELPAAIVGQLGEAIVAREYRRDGWGIIASCKFNDNGNEAPAIEVDDGDREITPDLDISRGGRRYWIEVKTHEVAAHARILSKQAGQDVFVHGVSARLFNNYKAVEQRSGSAVFLAIVQLNTREILISRQPITQLIPHPCFCGCRSIPGRCTSKLSKCPACRALPHACPEHRKMYPQFYWETSAFDVRATIDNKAFSLLHEKHQTHKDDLTSHAYRRHGSIREPAPESAFTRPRPPWTWACLLCNATGIGDPSVHRCPSDVSEYRRGQWIWRLQWAIPGATREQISAILDKPVAREQLAAWLGPSWLPGGDFK